MRDRDEPSGAGPVVVGTDFSETSGLALARGRLLASALAAPLEVVHVVGPQARDAWQHDPDALRWLAEAGLSAGDIVTRRGMPWIALGQFAGGVGASLLVIGTHGRSGYQPLVLGSAATWLALSSPLPVVLVSPHTAGRHCGWPDVEAELSRAVPGTSPTPTLSPRR